MLAQLILGLILLFLGIYFSSFGVRPWIDYNFIIGWVGLLLMLNYVTKRLSNISLLANIPALLLLTFASGFFWWFYELINLFTQNWAYPQQSLYGQVQFGILASNAFMTVIPLLVLCTAIVLGLYKRKVTWKPGTLSKEVAYILILFGLTSLILCFITPVYAFPLTWFIIFLVFDPINALKGRRSLIVQLKERNYQPLVILAVAAILAGFFWETMNHFIPKWTYPIEPWFWKLPPPITSKYIQMPLAGFLGYIPFIYSAFALVEYLDIKIPWLSEKLS